MKTRKYNRKIHKRKKKSTRKQKTNRKKQLKNKTIKVIKYKSLRNYNKHQINKKTKKTKKGNKKTKNKQGGMSWPAGVAIGMITVAGLGLGAAAVGGAKQANLVLKGKADDRRETQGLRRTHTVKDVATSRLPQKITPKKFFSLAPSVPDTPMSLEYNTEEEGNDYNTDNKVDNNPRLYGESSDLTKVDTVKPQELSATMPVRYIPQRPFEEIKGENYGKPNPRVNMEKIHTQREELVSVPVSTPYPPPPKATPLQPDNEPIKKMF